MKKIIKALLIVFATVLITGCGDKDKEVINVNKFITIANNHGYKVVDSSSKYDYADSVYQYVSDATDMFFIIGKESNIMNTLYLDEVSNYAKEAGEEAKSQTRKGKNYSIYIATNKDDYFFVGRVGKSYIKVKTKLSMKNKLISFLEEIGYY